MRERPELADGRTRSSHRVLIIGSGFGGLYAARGLRRAAVQVTVIDRTNHHLFQPLLYQVATGILSSGDVAVPTRDIVKRQANAEVLLGEVRTIDLAAREVTGDSMGSPFTRSYDSLIVAAGAASSYFGHDELARFAPGLKTIDDALELRGRIFGAFEMAELERDRDRRRAWLTFAIVGAGPTGVELAGEIAELSRRALKDNFRHIDPACARVVLLDAADTLLSAFPPRLQGRAQRSLESLGVEIRLGVAVTGIDDDGVALASTNEATGPLRIAARTTMWAAGVQASPLGRILAAQSKLTVDRAGRVPVAPDLTLPGYPEVFVVGDLMALDGLPGVAEVALQAGRHAARTIARRQRGVTEPRPFRYQDLGMTATISRFRAVVVAGPVQLAGVAGWLVWLFVHLLALTGFRNRFSAVVNWAAAFLGNGRPERTITQQQTNARVRALSPGTATPAARPVLDREPLRPERAIGTAAGGAASRQGTRHAEE